MEYLFGILVIAALFYLVYLRSKFEANRDNLIFDNLVLGCVDGLLFALNATNTVFIAETSVRSYVKDLLEQAHRIPGNKHLIEYTAPNGFAYHSHTGLYGEHYLFAILCLVKYAEDHEIKDLLVWCESELNLASKMSLFRF